ncbi:hypothetical protein C1646_748276 [Rhizophagus diaphanus]|nr:hypothetical protein C1646_748276 [Rhizophagus diaphanus] [Rhizophagus sp. MUCL 43196]
MNTSLDIFIKPAQFLWISLTNVNMSSSTEWFDAQLRLLINEPNKKKQDFWDDIASKLNEQENTNFFLGKDCHKKFLSLTKVFNTAKRYREGTGTKKSLVGKNVRRLLNEVLVKTRTSIRTSA